MNPYVHNAVTAPEPPARPRPRARPWADPGRTRAGAPSPYLIPAIYQYRVREGWGTIAECARAPLTLDTTQGQRDTLPHLRATDGLGFVRSSKWHDNMTS